MIGNVCLDVQSIGHSMSNDLEVRNGLQVSVETSEYTGLEE